MKSIIGITCLLVALYQCIQLVANFNAKETIRKNSNIFVPGDLFVPEIIVCSDPPHLDVENNLITVAKGADILPPVMVLNTSYKVRGKLVISENY